MGDWNLLELLRSFSFNHSEVTVLVLIPVGRKLGERYNVVRRRTGCHASSPGCNLPLNKWHNRSTIVIILIIIIILNIIFMRKNNYAMPAT